MLLRAFFVGDGPCSTTAMDTGSGKGWDPLESSHSPTSAVSNFGIPVKAGLSQSRNPAHKKINA
jgi:hypothetical protein